MNYSVEISTNALLELKSTMSPDLQERVLDLIEWLATHAERTLLDGLQTHSLDLLEPRFSPVTVLLEVVVDHDRRQVTVARIEMGND